jgi:hypothetical protein
MTSVRKSDERFRQLMDLAEGGNAEAVADLWREFQQDIHAEGSIHE